MSTRTHTRIHTPRTLPIPHTPAAHIRLHAGTHHSYVYTAQPHAAHTNANDPHAQHTLDMHIPGTHQPRTHADTTSILIHKHSAAFLQSVPLTCRSEDDLYGTKAVAPKDSVPHGDDFGRHSVYESFDVDMKTSYLETLILADTRCYQITVKLVADGKERRNQLRGNTIVFTHAPEGFAAATFGEQMISSAVAGLNFVMVGPSGFRGKLERSALLVPDVSVSPIVLWNNLQIRHQHQGRAAPPPVEVLESWVAQHSVEAHVKKSARFVDDAEGVGMENATEPSDVANVRDFASSEAHRNQEGEAGAVRDDAVLETPTMETVGVMDDVGQGMDPVIRGIAKAVEQGSRRAGRERGGGGGGGGSDGDDDRDDDSDDDGRVDGEVTADTAPNRDRGGGGNDGGHDGDDGGGVDCKGTAARVVNVRRVNDPENDYNNAADTLYATWWPKFRLGSGLMKGKTIPKQKMRHMFLYFDNRYAHELPLMFHCANTVLRHAVNQSVGARVKSSKSAFADFMQTINDPRFVALLEEAKLNPKGPSARLVTKTIILTHDHPHTPKQHSHTRRTT